MDNLPNTREYAQVYKCPFNIQKTNTRKNKKNVSLTKRSSKSSKLFNTFANTKLSVFSK